MSKLSAVLTAIRDSTLTIIKDAKFVTTHYIEGGPSADEEPECRRALQQDMDRLRALLRKARSIAKGDRQRSAGIADIASATEMILTECSFFPNESEWRGHASLARQKDLIVSVRKMRGPRCRTISA